MCYVLSKATDRQPGSLNPGFPSPIRKMRPFCYRISKRKFLTCVLSTTYAFHRVKRSISLPRLANASERNRTLLPGSLQGKQNETKRDDFTISSHFNIAVPNTYDDSPPRCLIFAVPASDETECFCPSAVLTASKF